MQNVKAILIKVFKVVVYLEIGWLVLGNIFLNTPIGPWAMSIKAEKFVMQWDSGYTLYPFNLNVNNAKVSIYSWSTDTEITVDHAQASINILPLVQKRLLINGLEGGVASVSITREVPEGERPEPSKPYPGMTMEFRNAQVEKVEKLAFNGLVLSGGETRASGSAQIQFRGDKVISDVDVEWQDASLEVGGRTFTNTVSMTATGGIDAFNPRVDKGFDLAEKVNGHVTVNGSVGTLAPLKVFFPSTEWVEAIDGEGNVAIDATLVRGKLQEGTIIDIEANGLQVDFLGFRAQGSGRVDGTVVSNGDSREGSVNLVFDDFELARRGGTEGPLIEGTGFQLTTKAPDLGLTSDVSGLVISLDIPNSVVPDITVLDDYLPPSLAVSISQGSAQIQSNIEVSGPEQSAKGDLHITGNDLKGSFRDLSFSMDLALDSELAGERLDDFQLGLKDAQFKLFNGIFDDESVEEDERWWMTIDIPEGNAKLSEPAELAADIDLSMKDTRAIIALFSEVKDWINRFDGFLTVNDVAGSAHIEAREKQLEVSGLQLAGDRLDMVAELRASEAGNDAIVWGKLGIFSLGFQRIGEEIDWKLINGRKWFDERKEENW